jgi:phage regulator Rha-like protein
MGDVWIRDTPFGPVTDSLKVAEHFDMKHHNVFRAIDKCTKELGTELKFEFCKNLIENSHLSGPKGLKESIERLI